MRFKQRAHHHVSYGAIDIILHHGKMTMLVGTILICWKDFSCGGSGVFTRVCVGEIGLIIGAESSDHTVTYTVIISTGITVCMTAICCCSHWKCL